jgi:hypothetical protein
MDVVICPPIFRVAGGRHIGLYWHLRLSVVANPQVHVLTWSNWRCRRQVMSASMSELC